MANSDRDRNATKIPDGQVDFGGGMNLIDDASKMKTNQFRLGTNIDIRTGNAEKAKGQQAVSACEIGAKYYDRFASGELEAERWNGYDTGDGSIVVTDNALVLTGVTSGHAWDGIGVVAQEQTSKATLGYIEFTLTTPSSVDSNSRFRIGLSASATALDTDSGLEIEFDESLDIIKREASSETDTTVNWVAGSSYRVRIEKKATGWIAYLVDLTSAEHTAVSLFDTTYTGTADNYLEFQAYGSAWTIDDIIYCDGFGVGEARAAAQGMTRFYKETENNETIIAGYGKIYKYTDDGGYTTIGDGLDPESRVRFKTFNDELYIINGVDVPKIYNSVNMQTLGSGGSAAPRASYIEVHLQSLFMAKDNSLFRNTPGNTREWDALDPVVDVDAWNGDVIKGLVKLGANLFIIKSSSVWELIGTTENNFVLRRVLGTRGCLSPDSIATNGQIVFWRGPDGVYKFDGAKTTLVSFPIHPAFDPKLRSEFPATLASADTVSVGVIHDFKYRLSVVQYGEEDLTYNNYEYVFDTLANGQQGGWVTRSNRNVGMYSVWDGDEDNNELYYVPSDTNNSFMRAEIDNGNYRNTHTSVTLVKKTDVDFSAKLVSRKYNGTNDRDFLDKTWQDIMVLFEPRAKVTLGFKTYTKYNTPGTLKVFTTSSTFQNLVANGSEVLMDGTEYVTDPYVEEKTKGDKFGRITASQNKNQGTEVWWEINQDASTRTAKLAEDALLDPVPTSTFTGLLTNPGNFEPFSIKKVIVRFTEANH